MKLNLNDFLGSKKVKAMLIALVLEFLIVGLGLPQGLTDFLLQIATVYLLGQSGVDIVKGIRKQ